MTIGLKLLSDGGGWEKTIRGIPFIELVFPYSNWGLTFKRENLKLMFSSYLKFGLSLYIYTSSDLLKSLCRNDHTDVGLSLFTGNKVV